MDHFQRAYRDQKSPLTPLTPMASNTAFDFNFGGDNTLKSTIDNIKRSLTPNSGHPKRYCEDYRRANDCMEVKTQKTCEVKIQITTTTTTNYEKTPKKSLALKSPQKPRLPFGQHQPLAASTSYMDYNNNVSVSASRQQKQVMAMKMEQEQVQMQNNNKYCPYKQESLSVYMEKAKQSYIKSSPIQLRPLSPRTSMLLSKVGQQKYKRLFQREEIDLCVFRKLQDADLIKMGIHCAEDRSDIMHAVNMSYKFLTKH